MTLRELEPQGRAAVEQVLGYMNYSTGTPDAQFLANLNLLYEQALRAEDAGPAWPHVLGYLRDGLKSLGDNAAFRDTSQAAEVLRLLADHVLQAYVEFHRDLLFHQSEATLFGPFFVGRACEAILRQGPP